jgi:hypothetical protein
MKSHHQTFIGLLIGYSYPSSFLYFHLCFLNYFYFPWPLCGLAVRVPGYRSRGPGFDSRRYQIFWEVVGLERDPLSLVSITEELLEWKSSGSGSRKPRLTAVGIRCADHATPLCPQKLALTSPAGCGRSVGIVRLRTKIHVVFYLSFLFVSCFLLTSLFIVLLPKN